LIYHHAHGDDDLVLWRVTETAAQGGHQIPHGFSPVLDSSAGSTLKRDQARSGV